MKKVLSYILISFVVFANLFAPVLVQAVIGDKTTQNPIGAPVTDINKKNEPVVGTADFEMQASTETTDASVKLIVNINNKSSVLQNAEFGTIFDLILDINITDMTGKNIDGVTGLIDNQNRTNPFTQRFDKNFNQDAYTKIHEGKAIEYNFKGLNSETKYQVVMNLKESTFITGVGTSTPNIVATSTTPFVTNIKGVTTLVKQEGTANINVQTPTKKMPGCSLNPLSEGTFMGCIAQGFYYVLFMPTSYLFALAGTFFDYTFSYSVQDSSYRSAFVVQGWGLVRDFCNIFFIFVMLYIAIGTILSLHNFKTKETIINVVIIGLFINFSLFATQVIIDASNITARVFYNSDAIKITEKGANSVTENTTKIAEGGIIPLSSAIVNKVNPQNMIIRSGQINNIPDKGGASSTLSKEESAANMDAGTFILIVIMASAINIVGLTVFFTIGFLFVARVIGLWLAMIMAPLAFFTYILPQMEGIKTIGWKNWWPETLKLAFLAPVFIFFMYLILKFLSMDLISESMNKTWASDGLGFFVATIIPFVFIMILMLKAKKIAIGMSGEFGEMATKLGSSVGGMVLGGAAGAGAMVLRGTLGQAGDKLANSKFANSGGAFGRKLKDIGAWTGSKTFDARNTKLGGMATKELGVDMGKAKDGGFTKFRADRVSRSQKRANELEVHEDEDLKQNKNKLDLQLKDLQDNNHLVLDTLEAKITAGKAEAMDKSRTADGLDAEIRQIKENGGQPTITQINAAKKARQDSTKSNSDLQELKDKKNSIRTGGAIKNSNGDITGYNTSTGNITQKDLDDALNNETAAALRLEEAESIAMTAQGDSAKLLADKNKEINDILIADIAAVKKIEDAARAASPTGTITDTAILDNIQTLRKTANDKAKSAINDANIKAIETVKAANAEHAAAEENSLNAIKTATQARDSASKKGGVGRSMNQLQYEDIPEADAAISHANVKRKTRYAKNQNSGFNKAYNFITSGGQDSGNVAREAEYKIRMGAKVESSGGHGGGASHAAPVAHATPVKPTNTTPTGGAAHSGH